MNDGIKHVNHMEKKPLSIHEREAKQLSLMVFVSFKEMERFYLWNIFQMIHFKAFLENKTTRPHLLCGSEV